MAMYNPLIELIKVQEKKLLISKQVRGYIVFMMTFLLICFEFIRENTLLQKH